MTKRTPIPRRPGWDSSARFDHAMDLNIANIRRLIEHAAAKTQTPTIADLGCWDGTTTLRYMPTMATIVGVELDAAAAQRARDRQMTVEIGDLAGPLPLHSDAFDIVSSNQVIEHLPDTDLLVAECFRILKPGGSAVISTENLASWHNIGALFLGWQAFSLGNVSGLAGGLGNPLANVRGEVGNATGWQHLRIFSTRGLKELLEVHGFVDVRVAGAGYYPFPPWFGRIDPRHAVFITAVGRKPDASRSPI